MSTHDDFITFKNNSFSVTSVWSLISPVFPCSCYSFPVLQESLAFPCLSASPDFHTHLHACSQSLNQPPSILHLPFSYGLLCLLCVARSNLVVMSAMFFLNDVCLFFCLGLEAFLESSISLHNLLFLTFTGIATIT